MNLFLADGLYPWSLTLADGQTRTIMASSLRAALAGVLPSPVVAATRGAAGATLPPPTVGSLNPTSAKLGDPNFTLHVLGTNFGPGAVIVWNGSPEPTTRVSATELTTLVNMTTAQVAMPIPVSVRSAYGEESNAVTFTILPAA